MLKKVIFILILAITFSTFTSGHLEADEDDMRIIFKDSIYGGLIGTIVGGAIFLFDIEKDNIKYFGFGAGGGIIAGTTYGIVSTAIPMFEYKQGNLHIGMPILQTKVKHYRNNKTGVTLTSEMFRLRF